MTVRSAVSSTVALVVLLVGCTSVRVRDFPLAEGEDASRVVGVLLQDPDGLSQRIEFEDVQSVRLTDSSVVMTGELDEYAAERALPYLDEEGFYHFPADRVQGVLRRETSAGKVAAAILIPVGVLAIIVAASSCPILYSWDGEIWHADAEPLGGATTRGLARRDLSRLERMRPVDGRYRLAAVNEMDETQFVDALSLLVVDHPAGSQVFADRQGGLHLISEPVAPRSVTTQDGSDVRVLLLEEDGEAFSYPMEASVGREDLPPRDSVLLEFDRPEGAMRGELVIRASTTPWGAVMLRRMLELWGSEVDEWYRLLDGSAAARSAQEEWVLREEHWVLKVWVEGRDGWEAQEVVMGNGPILPETQVVPLDLSAVDGERVRVRVDPPRGFWTIDYAAMDFSEDQDLVVHTVEALEAREDDGGADVLTTLASEDSSYVEMPEVGDRFTLDFPVPDVSPTHAQRTVFASTAGYYRIHTDRSGDRQGPILDRLWLEPDFGVELSFRTFADWWDGSAVSPR